MSDPTTSKTNGETKVYIPSDSIKVMNTTMFFLLLLDLYLINFLFVQNVERSFETGLFNALWLQFPVVGAVLLLDKWQIKREREEIKKLMGYGINSTRKVPLHSQVGEDIDNFSKTETSITDIVFYVIFYDLLVMGIVLFYGFIWNPLLVFAVIAYQGYILPPLLITYVYFNRKNFGETLAKQKGIQVDQRSFIEKFKNLTGKEKYRILGGLLLLLLSISLLWTVPFQEDHNTDTLDIYKQSPGNFTSYTPHYIHPVDGGSNIVGTMNYPNQYGKLFHYLVFLEVRNGDIVDENILEQIGRANESVVDTVNEGDQLYLLLHNDDFHFYEVKQIDLEEPTIQTVAMFNVTELESTRYRAIFTMSDDQFILANSPYREDIFTPTSSIRFIDRDQPTNQTLIKNDHNIYDMIVHQEELVLVSQPLQQNTYYEMERLLLPLTSDTSDGNLSVLQTEFSENQLGIPLPHGLTLFEVQGDLFYHSINNIHSISRNISTSHDQELVDGLYFFESRLFPGFAINGDTLIISAGEHILYMDIHNLEVVAIAEALHTGYRGAKSGNMVIQNEVLISFATTGIVYYWPADISSVKQNRVVTTVILISSVIIFLTASVILLYYWRDLTLLRVKYEKHN